eukprot:14950573-Alexandrium_andersonii.AAC.1
MWRVRHTPRWSVDQVTKWLQQLGWTEVEVQSPPSANRNLGWLIRARPHANADSWRISVEGHSQHIEIT